MLVAKWKKLAKDKPPHQSPEKPEKSTSHQKKQSKDQPTQSSSLTSSSKPVKQEEGEDDSVSFNNSNSGFSFGDALMMPVDHGKKKKKKKRKENDLLKVCCFYLDAIYVELIVLLWL